MSTSSADGMIAEERKRSQGNTDGDIALLDAALRRPSFVPQSKEAVRKSGEVFIQDSNTVRKLLLKNWKPAHAMLEQGRVAVYKTSAMDKLKHDLPLAQSYVTNGFFGSEEEKSVSFYFRTAKGEEEVMKTTSKDEARDWILCIKTNAKIIDNNVMKSLQFPEPFSGFEERVLKMGWIREKTLSYSWKWRYMILTDYAAYLYEKAPGSASQLTGFTTKYPLVSSKQKEVDTATFNDAVEEDVKFAFALLSQTQSSFIATETKNEHKNWLNAMKSMAMAAIKKVDTFNFQVTLPSDEKGTPTSTLTVKRTSGFSLKKPDGTEAWNKPLNQFKQFKVDKKSLLLDFGKFSEIPIELLSEDTTHISIVITLVVESFMDPSRLMA